METDDTRSAISKFFLLRYFLVLLAVLPTNLLLDSLLGVKIGEGRDNLIFYSLLAIGTYYFAWKPAKKREKALKDSKVKSETKDKQDDSK